jgi:hypothetical protein
MRRQTKCESQANWRNVKKPLLGGIAIEANWCRLFGALMSSRTIVRAVSTKLHVRLTVARPLLATMRSGGALKSKDQAHVQITHAPEAEMRSALAEERKTLPVTSDEER